MKRTFITLMLFCTGLFFGQQLTLANLLSLSEYNQKEFGDFVTKKGYHPHQPINFEFMGIENTKYMYKSKNTNDVHLVERYFSQGDNELSITWTTTNTDYYNNTTKSIKGLGFQLKESGEDKEGTYSIYIKDNIEVVTEKSKKQDPKEKIDALYFITVFRTL